MSVFTKKKEDFMEWYLDVVRKAQVVDTRTEVKGMNVLLSNGYDIWDRMKKILDEKFYITNHKNMYFPLFIPEKFLELESEHFEGFVPEVAYVTHAGKKKLDKKFALRPTSETIMYHMYSQWIRAYTDMPLKVNQWCNIIRIDTKDTKPLLRDREFQWTEAHTCHATPEEAVEQVKESMWIYGSFYDECCLPYLVTKRPKYDTFPGALYSVAYDTPLPDGKTLQIGTTHNLDQGFAKVFNIRFQKEDGDHDYAYQTCYGLSTRVLAAVIGVHGDDRGLIIPPNLAPLQVIIVPILFKGKEEIVDKSCKAVLEELRNANVIVRYDDSDKTSGFKFNEYELQGVPVRIEIGPKDVEKGGVTLARRDTKERIFVERSKIVETVRKTFDQIIDELKSRAKKLLEDSISEVVTYEELEEKFSKTNPGFVKTNWCGDVECADLIKDKLKADIRGTLYGKEEETTGPCIICTENAEEVVYISRAY